MPRLCFSDIESFSEIPINCGSYRYAEKAEVLLWSYAFDDGPVKVWDRTADPKIPKELKTALDDEKVTFVFHNGGNFDRVVIEHSMGVVIKPERMHDTLAQAYAHGLPGGLEILCDIFQAPTHKAKDKNGKKLIKLFCIPNKDGGRATAKTHPQEWQHFKDYAALDIEAMRFLYGKIPNWNYQGFEYNLWCLDQKINKKGFATDTDLIAKTIKTVDGAQESLRLRTVEATEGEVSSTTRRNVLLKYVLATYGVDLPDMQASTLERRIEDPQLPEGLRELLKIRLMACTSSTAKYKRILSSVSSDGRLRGTLQWCGAAHTGRDAGRILNPQNFPRPDGTPEKEIEFGIEALKADCADLFYDNVMQVASKSIRGVIVAPPGKKLCVSDLSNIEGRYAAWLADEKWKLQAFRDQDVGKGHDLYAVAYAKAFRVTPESVIADKKKGGNQRQISKTMELALQFQGGVGAFSTFALSFGIDLNDIVKAAASSIPADIRKEAEGFWGWAVGEKRTLGLEHDVFVACDALKRVWRNAHPNIVALWHELEEAARSAIETKNTEFEARKLILRRDGNWLRIVMPSGRSLSYPAPRVDNKGQITFMGIDQYSRSWRRIKTFAGKLFNNCLTSDTLVLCDTGWKPLYRVTLCDRVWDGENWVAHRGVIDQGIAEIGYLDGIGITPDHEVLCEEGWQKASSCKGLNRAPVLLPQGFEVCGLQQERQISLVCKMRLWEKINVVFWKIAGRFKSKKILRLYDENIDWKRQYQARDVPSFSLSYLAQYAGSMPSSNISSMEKLWGERNSSLPGVVQKFSSFCKRYGIDLSTGPDDRKEKQQSRVQQKELCVAYSQSSSEQYSSKSLDEYTLGHLGYLRSKRTIGNRKNNSPLSFERWSNRKGTFSSSGPKQPVFDILDAGQAHRFTVLGENGPFIVHNCVQGGARDVFMHGVVRADCEGYETVLRIHDEIVAETPDTKDFTAEKLSALLATNPSWAGGLPLAAGGYDGYRYRKAD